MNYMPDQFKSMINNSSNVTVTANHVEWRWPVPLLFGGIAAMLVIVAFTVLILVCSYWKSIDSPNNEQGLSVSAELGVHNEMSGEDIEEEKVVVIMAGQHNPTFLARPAAGSYSALEV